MTGLVDFASHLSAAASDPCWEFRLKKDSVQSTMHSSTWGPLQLVLQFLVLSPYASMTIRMQWPLRSTCNAGAGVLLHIAYETLHAWAIATHKHTNFHGDHTENAFPCK